MVDWNGHFRVYCKKMTGQRRERHGTAADRMRGDGGGKCPGASGRTSWRCRCRARTLFRRALEAVPAERFVRTVVVSQYPEVLELAHRMGFVPVPNRHPDWGISHTISLGLGKLPEMDAALFQVADQPLLRRESVGMLVDFYREHPEHIAALGHDGVRGNPCLFPARLFPELLALQGDHGGNQVIRPP